MWKDIITEDLISINPQISDKADLFDKMVNHAYSLDYILNRKKFLKAIWIVKNSQILSSCKAWHFPMLAQIPLAAFLFPL